MYRRAFCAAVVLVCLAGLALAEQTKPKKVNAANKTELGQSEVQDSVGKKAAAKVAGDVNTRAVGQGSNAVDGSGDAKKAAAKATGTAQTRAVGQSDQTEDTEPQK